MAASRRGLRLLDVPRGVLLFQLLTVSRVFIAAAFAIMLCSYEPAPGVLKAGLVLIVLIELTDLLDGVIARRFKLVSKLGAMLDAYTDSLSRLTVYWALALSGFILPWVPLLMALRDVSVAYCRIVFALGGEPVSAHISGKVKAEAQALGAMLAVLGPLYWNSTGTWTVSAISWFVAVITAGSLIEYGLLALRVARRGRK